MIDREKLLSDLQDLLKRLEADLLDRSDSTEVPMVGKTLRSEYERAKDAERTGQNFEDWRSDAITQNAAAWVLSCVFVRFLEDNLLIDPPKIAGPDERLQRARDEHEIYFRKSPTETDREYLLAVFDDLAELPGTEDIFGEHNPIRELSAWLSGDAAGELLRFFQKIDADSGVLVHDFTDPDWDTRFLGDLYQDLSESARKKYALLQTPEFVEEFILDRTLDPAIDELGLEGFKMIDPACGSGHFLLGAFRRIEARWEKQAPAAKCREVVQRTLDSIFGVDVNPFAVAIARFRLLLAALRTCGVMRLTNSPAFHVNLVCGDSLYHGRQRQQMLGDDWTDEAHYFAAEDAPALRRMLRDGAYHCVVANPPYITPKDRAANLAYRKLYPKTCYRQYSLAVPFMERIYRLAVPGGFTGQITANSFMKREFGKKLIEQFLPQVDLSHVIDTSGAYIPGHGTPTVILFGRHRKPIAKTIRTVMGIRGEPTTPEDPSRGLVWSAIVEQIDQTGSQSEFLSVADSPGELFQKHPWSIRGGGAAELKDQLDHVAEQRLLDVCTEIGFGAVTRDDDAFVIGTAPARRLGIEGQYIHNYVVGEQVRDWSFERPEGAIWPYDAESLEAGASRMVLRFLWRFRRQLCDRVAYGHTQLQRGLKWFEYSMFFKERFRSRFLLTFACVATHNNFVLSPGGILFNRHAPVIKLPPTGAEDDHLALLGLLNSSTACFWMKQVFHNKGSSVDQRGARQTTVAFENFWEHDGTKLKKFPLPASRPLASSHLLNQLAQQLSNLQPSSLVASRVPTAKLLRDGRDAYFATRGEMILEQEELDWQCYRLYGLLDEDLHALNADELPDRIDLGQRSFEIVMARKIARGEIHTTWFDRHGSTPVTELPADWPEDYRRLVERRIEAIENDKNIGLIEQPEYKRRWNTEPWDSQLERALREWMLDRMESYFDFDGRMNDDGKPTAQLDIALTSVARLADVARRDTHFMEVAGLYRDDPAFDVERLVAELVAVENVPLLPVLRYKPSGQRKRAEWERTWELQRQEDAIDARTGRPEDDPQYLTEIQAGELKREEIGDIPVPPKYKSSDFISIGGARYWHLRGKLDVPKEHWVSFPQCEGEDGTLMIAWAGYDHLQLARAVSAYYVDIQERLGGRDDPRLEPLLACLIELLPWLKQWHNEVDPEFNVPMGDYFEGFIQEETRQMNKTAEEVKNWQPPKKKGGRKRK